MIVCGLGFRILRFWWSEVGFHRCQDGFLGVQCADSSLAQAIMQELV